MIPLKKMELNNNEDTAIVFDLKINKNLPMKKISVLFTTLFFLIISINCSSQKMNQDNLKRQWMLVSFKNFEKSFLVKNKAQLDMSSAKTKDNYSIFMGCNNMFVVANFEKNGTVKFGDMGTTMKYCEGNMKLEKEFSAALANMNSYKIEGHQLTLSDKEGNKMIFVAADWD